MLAYVAFVQLDVMVESANANFSFVEVIKPIDGSTIQYVKGLITPQSSLNIRTYDDIEVRPDDLIVIGGSLYAVENLEATYKQMPKRFGIYYMTLNNIL